MARGSSDSAPPAEKEEDEVSPKPSESKTLNKEGEGPPRKWCGFEINPQPKNMRQCGVYIKILQIVVNFLSLFLSVVTMVAYPTLWKDEERGHSLFTVYGLFILIVLINLFDSIFFFAALIAVADSKKNRKLQTLMIVCDMICGVMTLLGLVMHIYILFKWELEYKGASGKDLPFLGEMVTITMLTLLNSVLYMLGITCRKSARHNNQ